MPATDTNNHFSLAQELQVAVTTASLGDKGKTRRVMLVESNLPSIIPSQSLLKVRSLKFQELKKGDIICVRIGSGFWVRRFIKSKMTRDNTLLLVAQEGFDKKESIPMNALLGKVDEVEHNGRAFDPLAGENFLKSFWGKLTEYGTHKAFGFIG
ncbi:MAG: hypothetical protein WC314_18970 [Vulcanimicrobiota bacterium]